MRIRQRYTHKVVQGDLTPMIDMTFQLIAFFMVLINFSDAEQDDRVKLPQSELAKPPEARIEDSITIQMTKDARCIIGGQIMPLNQVKLVLIREAQLMRLSNKALSDATIIIRADRLAASGEVRRLMEICQEIGYEVFKLRALQEMAHLKIPPS